MNVTDLVNVGSDNSGQDTKVKANPKISEEGDVDGMDSSTIDNEISCMKDPFDNPPSEKDIEDNPYKDRNIGMHKKTQEHIQQKGPWGKRKSDRMRLLHQ